MLQVHLSVQDFEDELRRQTKRILILEEEKAVLQDRVKRLEARRPPGARRGS